MLAVFLIAHGVYTLTPHIGTIAPTTFMLGLLLLIGALLMIGLYFRALWGIIAARSKWALVAGFLVAFLGGIGCVTLTAIRIQLNVNTIQVGWPMPAMFWQRDDLDMPYLDYVGIIAILAYPINFVIISIIPLSAIAYVYRIRNRNGSFQVQA